MENGHLKNGDGKPEKILVYLGPSLPLAAARAILPGAIYKPPCKQGDITSDVVNHNPTRIILIDGEFRGNLSPWHKEIIYALQYPGLKGIYGAASMGALRAAELEWVGMIGLGKIFEWYRDGTTEDDAEVALLYTEREGIYWPKTIPLVNIRAAVSLADPVQVEFLEAMRQINYTDRSTAICQGVWTQLAGGGDFPCVDQKGSDAAFALADFEEHKSKATTKLSHENLSAFFQALYERDRRISINGQEVQQQCIDSHVMLHNPEYERISWDAANQELALLLCDCLCVLVGVEEVSRENERFQVRASIEKPEDFEAFLENNGWTRHEYDRLMVQNARIRKLQHCMTVTKGYRRNTQSVLDYLRTHQAFDYWAVQVAQEEARIARRGVDEWLGVNIETPAFALLNEHFDKEGLELKMFHEEYLLETGFANCQELGIALARVNAGKE